MRGLTWGKVNLHAHTIDVAQRADNMKGLNIGAPKSRDSRRTVPMPPSVAHALRYLKTVSLFTNDSDYVWPNEEGGVAKLSALVTEIFNPAHVAAGIPLVDYQPKYRPHAPRQGTDRLAWPRRCALRSPGSPGRLPQALPASNATKATLKRR